MTTNTLRTKVSRSSLKKESLLQAKSEKVEMTLNTDSAVASGLLIQRLTELYEDPVEASVRETVSNALDAVMESYSGSHPEVHIVSPGKLNPVFTVRDNGIGMTYEDLKEIYSKYGASTKMNNFEQIGAYGLGAKAPLAYGTEFTVSSVKDGVRTTIIVVREETTNYIKIVDSVETDDPSGTTVSIPVSNYDIERFNSHINKYKENPIDKDVRMFVDHNEVKESKYIEIDNNVTIFKKDGEEVTARLWIVNDVQVFLNLLTSMDEQDVKRSLQYLIGGWAYASPERRNNSYGFRGRRNASVMVELKAGIVGFNSSRDAILENERYTDLENLVIEYIKSEAFMKALTKVINGLDIEKFKSILVSILKKNEMNITIENKELKISDDGSRNSFNYSRRIQRDYSISEFIHDETGFRFDHMLKGVPTVSKQSAAVSESKMSYRKTVYNSYLESYDEPGENTKHARFKSYNASEVVAEIEDVMYKRRNSHSLESLMLNLALAAYADDVKNMRVTFVTDIEADLDEQDKTTNFSRVRSGRKTIVRMRNEGKDSEVYDSYVIYTEHDKKAINKMLKEAKLDSLDVVVKTAEEIVEEMNEYRKANRTTSDRVVNKNLSTSIQKYDSETGKLQLVEATDIKKGKKKNIFIVSKEHYMNSDKMKMIAAWYCNEHKVTNDDFNLYSSTGMHRVIDVEVLNELGELYENPHSRHAGTSKLYTKVIDGKVADMHTINEQEDDLEKKSFVRLLASIVGTSPLSVMNGIIGKLNDAQDRAKIAKYELDTIPADMLTELGEFGNKEFGDHYYSRHWDIDRTGKKHLLQNIDKDKYRLIESLVALDSHNRISIEDDGSFQNEYYHGNIITSINQATAAYDDKNKKSAYHKMIRTQTEAYLEYNQHIIKELSTLKFS